MWEIYLENPEKGGIKKFVPGWSWTCFFFYFLGIPLFNRDLIGHGVAMLLLWVIMITTSGIGVNEVCAKSCVTIYVGDIVALIMIPFGVFYALKGNKMGIKELQKQGWIVCEPTKNEAKLWAENLIKDA